MASVVNHPTIEEHDDDGPLSLHEMFRVVGDQMTQRDVRVLKFLYTGILKDDIRCKINDGYDFLLSLERLGRCDESNFKHIIHLLKIITRHDLMQFVTLRRRKTVRSDPVDDFLDESIAMVTACSSVPSARKRPRVSELRPSLSNDLAQPVKKRRRRERKCGRSNGTVDSGAESVHNGGEDDIRKKSTCDVRLRVRAEYCYHDSVLNGNVFSNKPDPVERQFEKFLQANTILKSRDLGAITCDIKFSELTYLDAFWRDYINGSLLEALKGVFITESLKQAVGYQAIKLLVNVDEDDYEMGRLKLLQNLQK